MTRACHRQGASLMVGSRQRGIAPVELLDVLGVVGVLAAILLPAIQAARRFVRRLQCQNNVQQQGTAGLADVSLHKRFPTSGWEYLSVGEPNRGFGTGQPGGWIYNVLPFFEEAPLRSIGKSQPGNARRESLTRLLLQDIVGFASPGRIGADLQPANTTANLWDVNVVFDISAHVDKQSGNRNDGM